MSDEESTERVLLTQEQKLEHRREANKKYYKKKSELNHRLMLLRNIRAHGRIPKESTVIKHCGRQAAASEFALAYMSHCESREVSAECLQKARVLCWNLMTPADRSNPLHPAPVPALE